MKVHDVFFWCACFFLIGVLVASIASGFERQYLIFGLVVLLIGVFIFFVQNFNHGMLSRGIAALSLVMFIGGAYYFAHDFYQKDEVLKFGEKINFTGVIRDVKFGLENQKIRIGEIQITAQRYPEFEYGDKVNVDGAIKEIPEDWQGYFSKEDVFGLMSFPKIELISKNNGSAIKAGLLKINLAIQNSFKKVLPLEKAAFLSGLTLGETGEFSEEFEEKLRLTGTTHLVALSGYNIAVIATVVLLALNRWFSRWTSSLFAIIVIISFVVMTGAEASVVRAALMAMVLTIAEHSSRQYYFRNAIVFVALLMVLANPKVLVFDVGFQLSFLATLGIVYLRPVLKNKLGFNDESGFLSWKDNLLTTSSAQIAVLPILILSFGQFSPFSLLTNILILEFIPVTMAIGFFIAITSVFSSSLAFLLSLAIQPLLFYIFGVINIFAFIQDKIF